MYLGFRQCAGDHSARLGIPFGGEETLLITSGSIAPLRVKAGFSLFSLIFLFGELNKDTPANFCLIFINILSV